MPEQNLTLFEGKQQNSTSNKIKFIVPRKITRYQNKTKQVYMTCETRIILINQNGCRNDRDDLSADKPVTIL